MMVMLVDFFSNSDSISVLTEFTSPGKPPAGIPMEPFPEAEFVAVELDEAELEAAESVPAVVSVVPVDWVSVWVELPCVVSDPKLF